ncbi:MAG: molecular chaperone HtpG, partial [Lachnospiraceae bacterium]|nr:molecular chaperone HtpG [Lachnospiraceae bacterium]
NLEGRYVTLEEYIEASKKSGLNKAEEAPEGAEAGKEGSTDETAAAGSDAGSSDAAGDDKSADNGAADDDAENAEAKKDKVYYVTDEKQQSQYINMFKSEGLDAVLLTHNIDQPFISQLEASNDKVRFLRIDADVSDSVKEEVGEDEQKDIEKEQKELEKLFRKVLNKDKLEVKVEKLKSDKISAVITLSEESRRMSDMMKMYSMPGMGGDDMFGGQESLTLNANNQLVQFLAEHKKGRKVELIVAQLYDLAMLAHKPLAPEAMTAFVERSNEIMEMLSK